MTQNNLIFSVLKALEAIPIDVHVAGATTAGASGVVVKKVERREWMDNVARA